VEPKTVKARKTRERLLREAAQLFSVKGYFHTTVDDVMARAGLTKGGFYAHFDSKEALARAVIDHATTLWMEKVASHVARFSDPREQLRQVFEGYRLYAVDRTFEGGCFFVNLSTEVDDQHEDLRALVDERFVQFRMMVATIIEMGKALGAFRGDTPSEGLATAIVGYLTGTMMQAKATKDFTLFDAGNAVMTQLVSSFETPAPTETPARQP
jgi:TetR/AcrR family transcriptional repressor of nem operon